MRGARAPLTVRLYSAGSALLAPFAYARVRARLRAHGTPDARIPERLGHATAARPDGRLIWFHAASVGESVSVLRLITHLGAADPGLHFLLTSGTATSADVVAARLPARCIHQFAPLDSRPAVARFLAHWRPDAGVFVESELWPNMIRQAARAGVPLALLNARISERSARGWRRFGATARHLLGHFRLIHCQDARTAAHFHALGVAQAAAGQNLKAAAGPLPVDPAALRAARAAVGTRPVWVAASTHPGEDEIVLAAHRALCAAHPRLLLVLVPRHPERAPALLRLIAAEGLRAAQRSGGAEPGPDDAVWLADTLGETGLWYALSPLVCLGGSFVPVGGHNPFEPAQAGAVVLHGPLYANFDAAYAQMQAAGGALEVADAPALARALVGLLEDARALEAHRAGARAFAAAQDGLLDDLGAHLLEVLGLARDG